MLENALGATSRSRSGPERHYHSDTSRSLVFVTFWNAKNGPGATSPERHPQVAPRPVRQRISAWERGPGARVKG
ncbi:hypothetical protein F2Q69_00060410 [Brassica cretica]|uniref:Uncharacterized protein n=1 Tax=Brassica cretica TaxID=69181 RepID=A0A8S9RFX4_BRACR|nr:hypothetical protein F2Q69_00060410 [Brassica cretica]